MRVGDGGWWWPWIGWWWAANTALGGPSDGQARPMVTLERTMAAAARQGRDSCCQSARRSPEGGVKNGRLGAFWVWLQTSLDYPQSIDKVYIFVEPTTFVVRLSQGFAGHEALHRDPGTCGPRCGRIATFGDLDTTALVRDLPDARRDRPAAHRTGVGSTNSARNLVAGHPGQGGHPRVTLATMATNTSFGHVA